MNYCVKDIVNCFIDKLSEEITRVKFKIKVKRE